MSRNSAAVAGSTSCARSARNAVFGRVAQQHIGGSATRSSAGNFGRRLITCSRTVSAGSCFEGSAVPHRRSRRRHAGSAREPAAPPCVRCTVGRLSGLDSLSESTSAVRRQDALDRLLGRAAPAGLNAAERGQDRRRLSSPVGPMASAHLTSESIRSRVPFRAMCSAAAGSCAVRRFSIAATLRQQVVRRPSRSGSPGRCRR